MLMGYVPKSWLDSGFGTDYRVFLDFIDTDGQTFIGSSAPVRKGWFDRFRSKLFFYTIIQFDRINAHFIEKSQGRINIKISGHKDGHSYFLPLIIDGFEPEGGVDIRIEERHHRMADIVNGYEQDLKNYYKELADIEESRRRKDDASIGRSSNYRYAGELGFEMFKVLEESDDSYDNYLYSEEDRREKEITEKYKDALAWRGPLLRGIVAKFDAFEMRVYSDDHDQHFHVIHRGKNINARFSYPQMQLMSYVLGTTISAKTEQKIRDFCKKPEVIAKFEKEFAKRSKTP